MKKTLSFILLFIFSLASAQSKDKDIVGLKPDISLEQIISTIEKKELANEIRKAISSDFVLLNCNNSMKLSNFLKKNNTFFGKKIVLSNITEKNISKVLLNFHYSENTLAIEIQNMGNDGKWNYKTITYNYNIEK